MVAPVCVLCIYKRNEHTRVNENITGQTPGSQSGSKEHGSVGVSTCHSQRSSKITRVWETDGQASLGAFMSENGL